MRITYAPAAYVPERMSTRPARPEAESLRAAHAAFGIDWPPEPEMPVPNRRERRAAKPSRP